ncbi:MAG: hypothetical protein VX951_13855 [Planctomycetota bacterium]|nr:hypothetical protein [Planctomycetota bacterium]
MTKHQDKSPKETSDKTEDQRQSYERPRVESVKLNKDAAEALT